MGRKPNQAIRQFFERGPKLNDNSNRYQQTCRRCGEKFEKGRQEALIAHVAKICQGVSPQERERFLAEISSTRPNAKAKKPSISTGQPQALPELSGLDALAEVSRHHGQQSLQNDLLAQASEFLGHGDINANALLARSTPSTLPFHTTSSSNSLLIPTTTGLDLGLSDGLRIAALRALVPTRSNFTDRTLDADDGLVDYSHGEAPNIGMNYSRHAPTPVIEPTVDSSEVTDDLVDYSHGQAPAVDEHYTRHQQTLRSKDVPLQKINRALDPLLNGVQDTFDLSNHDQMRLVAGYVAHDDSARANQDMPTPASPRTSSKALEVSTTQPPSQVNTQPHFQIWNPLGAAPITPKKVRGAFATDRRAAVKEVRKKGACLRCRMLKKSCDSGDPCKECAKLENARMWKGQCVRTRLSQIFTVFSSTLFLNIAHNTVEQLRTKTTFTNLPGRLEVSYLPSAGLFMTFPGLRASTLLKDRARDIINTEDEGVGIGSTLESKIHHYGHRALSTHYDDVDGRKIFLNMSSFMHHTMKLAMTMQKCVLISRAIDLWLCVTFLTKPQEDLIVIHEPRLPPSNLPIDLGHDSTQRSEGVHYVYVQLRRKLERVCDAHFRAIMTELEKSLIQRKQADNFETLLGTTILLRCLEMVCYLYKAYDYLVEPLSFAARKEVLYGADSWPLEKPPSHYWQQGERFSDLLASMLKLRKVLPAYTVQDGKIGVQHESKVVQDWFDSIDLHVDVVQQARIRPYDVVDETAGEFRWMGKLFEV